MSCIRFNTLAMRRQMREPLLGLADGDAALLHLSPVVTESKIERLRILATHANPKIRESVASSRNTPADLIEVLAADPDEGVRACVARNETTSCDVLRTLAGDRSEKVRGWVALNYFVPEDAMERLSKDRSKVVRGLVGWKASIAEREPIAAAETASAR
ncbi:MAG: hypothetical protein JWP66_1099 [Naasia sp.]|nr:hypothetical protein [Naasia sp.]